MYIHIYIYIHTQDISIWCPITAPGIITVARRASTGLLCAWKDVVQALLDTSVPLGRQIVVNDSNIDTNSYINLNNLLLILIILI